MGSRRRLCVGTGSRSLGAGTGCWNLGAGTGHWSTTLLSHAAELRTTTALMSGETGGRHLLGAGTGNWIFSGTDSMLGSAVSLVRSAASTLGNAQEHSLDAQECYLDTLEGSLDTVSMLRCAAPQSGEPAMSETHCSHCT